MPAEKKNLSKLLNKNKKKKTTENTTSSKKEDEEAKPADSAIKDAVNDVESPEQAKAGALAKKNDNDDSSDDEIGYKIDIENKIIEQQAETSGNQDDLKADYMMKKDEKDESAQVNPKEKVKRNNASNIVFGGGRPQFSRKNPAIGIGGDDFVGIDEIGDDGKQKKAQKKNTAAQGGREFENLGSTAVAKNKKFEEEKEEKKPAERPRFFGKAKIGGGEQNKETTGQNITYDFGVKYKSENKDGDRKNHEKKDENSTEVRKDKRRINQEKGQRFGAKDQGLDDQDLDEGFEIVKDKNKARRQHRVEARTRDEDGEQKKDDDFKPAAKRGVFNNMNHADSD